MSTDNSVYPPSVSEETRQFIIDFFVISDTKPPAIGEGGDPYVTAFTEDAIIKIGKVKQEGAANIAFVRQGMWSKIVSRFHIVNKVFVHSESDLFLEGTVKYGLVNGKDVTVEWAGHMVFEEEKLKEGLHLLKFYQVYVDPSPVAAALA